MHNITKKALRFVWFILMAVICMLMIYPLIYSALGGFNSQSEFSSMGNLFPVPKKPVWNNYIFAFSSTVLSPLLNTFLRTAWYTVVVLIMTILIGYVMARYEFKGKQFFMVFIIVSQVIPAVLTLISTFVMVSHIPLVGGNDLFGNGGKGLYDSQLMLFLPLSWGYLLWPFLFMQSMKSLPRSFEEAAELDGAGFFQTILKVIVPMQKPILTVVAINVALNTWNDWMTPFLYINSTKKTTLPAYLATLTASLQNYGQKDYPKVFALATLAIIPPLFIFLFLQKYIVQGIASAGIKE
jgi:multiple sugar transport system permease protein